MLSVTGVAQFTVKTTNSEFDIYFLSLMSCSINRQVSHILFTCKNFTKIYVFRFNVQKNFLFQEMVGGLAPPCPLFLYGPGVSIKVKFLNNLFASCLLIKIYTFNSCIHINIGHCLLREDCCIFLLVKKNM